MIINVKNESGKCPTCEKKFHHHDFYLELVGLIGGAYFCSKECLAKFATADQVVNEEVCLQCRRPWPEVTDGGEEE